MWVQGLKVVAACTQEMSSVTQHACKYADMWLHLYKCILKPIKKVFLTSWDVYLPFPCKLDDENNKATVDIPWFPPQLIFVETE